MPYHCPFFFAHWIIPFFRFCFDFALIIGKVRLSLIFFEYHYISCKKCNKISKLTCDKYLPFHRIYCVHWIISFFLFSFEFHLISMNVVGIVKYELECYQKTLLNIPIHGHYGSFLLPRIVLIVSTGSVENWDKTSTCLHSWQQYNPTL